MVNDLTVQISKGFGSFTLDIDFSTKARRIGILGHSGSGKTLTLKCIAGLVTPDRGCIAHGGRVLFDSAHRICLRPQQRRIGYMFQNYALFPNMTVRQNIAAAFPWKERDGAGEILTRFGLQEIADKYPTQLSGGQQQRTAMARLLAYAPDMILLDEPFSALDDTVREQMQRELESLLADYTGTLMLVSHNRDEICRFCEALVVIDEGRSIVCGETQAVFDNPGTVTAARLTGCRNISAFHVTGARTGIAADWGLELHFPAPVPDGVSHVGIYERDILPVQDAGENCIRFDVQRRISLPSGVRYDLRTEAGGVLICQTMHAEGIPDYAKLSKLLLLKG